MKKCFLHKIHLRRDRTVRVKNNYVNPIENELLYLVIDD